MTINPRYRRALVSTIASLAVILAAAVPAEAKPSPVVRTSETVGGLAWASTSNRGQLLGTFASTLDRGATWTAAQNHEIGDLDPQLRWATASAGMGRLVSVVIRSTDGGATWHRLDSFETALTAAFGAPLGYESVTQVLVDPSRPGVVYATVDVRYGGKGGVVGVIESRDSGATWTTWGTQLDDFTYGTDSLNVREIPGRDALLVGRVELGGSATVSIATSTGRTPIPLTAGTGWTGRIEVDRWGSRLLLQTSAGWRLGNADGTNAHRLMLAGPIAPAFDPSRRGRLFALRGGRVFHSSDEGRHWVRRGTAPGSTGLAVDRGGRLVYAYGPNGVWISRDAGATFRQLGDFAGPLALSFPSWRAWWSPTVPVAAAGDLMVGAVFAARRMVEAPRPGPAAIAPTGDAVVLSTYWTSDIRSADGTWHSEPLPSGSKAGPVIDARGIAYVVTDRVDSEPGPGVLVSHLSVQVSAHVPGGSWTPPATVATLFDDVDVGDEAIATDANGDVAVVYETTSYDARLFYVGTVWATILRAGNAGWSPPVRISGDEAVDPHGQLLIAGGGAGTFVVAWDNAATAGALTGVPRAARIGATGDWSAPVDVLPLPGAGIAPLADSSLVVDAAGDGLLLAPTATGPESFTWAPGAASWTGGNRVGAVSPAGQSDGTPALALAPDGTATAVYSHASAHDLSLRASTSHPPYSDWSPEPNDIALAHTCPAGDCLAAAPAPGSPWACVDLCLAMGSRPAVASSSSSTLVEYATSRGLLVLTHAADGASWDPAASGDGKRYAISVVGKVHGGNVTVRFSCVVAPCTARLLLETAPGSPLGDRVQIATRTATLTTARPGTRRIALPTWARTALARAGVLPVELVLEPGDGHLAEPVVERGATLR